VSRAKAYRWIGYTPTPHTLIRRSLNDLVRRVEQLLAQMLTSRTSVAAVGNRSTASRMLRPCGIMFAMKYAIALALFPCAVLVCAVPSAASDIAPFTTDGCSSFPNGTPQNQSLWLDCCVRHDLAYWKGGTYQDRLDADLALEQCVATAGEPDIAAVMLRGVRAGGNPFLFTPYRWGYGWPFGRGYQPLSADEIAGVASRLAALEATLRELRESLLSRTKTQ
jgi:hypothetical protein